MALENAEMTPRATSAYAAGPCYPELFAIIAAGSLHVITELSLSAAIARAYNVIVSLAAVAYLVWRFRRTAGVLRVWGLRGDNFLPALRAQALFGAAGALVLLAYGAVWTTDRLPATFWLTLLLYPIWGIAQQFALQNLIVRNLSGLVSGIVAAPTAATLATAVAASVLFSASHYPRLELVILTFAAGVCFTLIYRRVPNLWAVGIVHGILGSLAYYVVLEEDPGAVIAGAFSR